MAFLLAMSFHVVMEVVVFVVKVILLCNTLFVVKVIK